MRMELGMRDGLVNGGEGGWVRSEGTTGSR